MTTIQIPGGDSYIIDGSSNTYIVAEGVTVGDQWGINGVGNTATSTADTLEINGRASGVIGFGGEGMVLHVGKTGSVGDVDFSGDTFTNEGLVSGEIYISNDYSKLINNGTVHEITESGQAPITLLDHSDVTEIRRTAHRGETTSTSNAGNLLQFTSYSADDTVINTGTIGLVKLGNGRNVFDSRDGIVTGSISGGSQSDTFYVSNQVAIEGGKGNDTVYSTVSFVLDTTSQIRTLNLIGVHDTDGTGDNGNNVINGNSGSNHLSGGAGNDTLAGFGGRDLLHGGDGADRFIFKHGFGHDTVDDFGGRDQIDLSHVQGIDSFKSFMNNNVTFEHGDAIVALGNDTLVVEHINHFERTDFVF